MPGSGFRRCFALLAVTLVAATAARAGAPPAIQLTEASPAREDIIVTAPAPATDREIERQAGAVTRVGDKYHDPLARFFAPVCPGVTGLPTAIAGMIADRIRYDAERIGAKVTTTEKCKPNILVAFVRDGAAEIRRLLENKGHLFKGLENMEVKALQNEAGPARAWSVVALRTRYGEPESAALQQGAVQISGNLSLGPVRVVTVPSSDSHIFLASRLDILVSVVVIDVTAIDGMAVDQIADYAAMRALARTRPVREAAPPTILSLFEPIGSPPDQLTDFDRAYLRSLYTDSVNGPATSKFSRIPHYIQRENLKISK